MPRVAGIYARPTGIDAVANNTIDSGKYNSNVADVEADLNLPRPIVAGGTGASNAHDARTNLQAEFDMQGPVDNYDTFPFAGGSFWSNAGASGAPTGNASIGICYVHGGNPAYLTIEARDTNESPPLRKYIRTKLAGVWSVWTLDNKEPFDILNGKVEKAGDTMTGHLVLPTGPAANNAVRKDYVDAADTLKADKTYVDTQDALKVAKAGDTMSGTLLLGGASTTPGVANTTTGIAAYPSGTIYANGGGATTLFASLNGDGYCVSFQRAGVQVGAINLYTGNTQYLTTSDGTLKEDLQPAVVGASQILNATEIYNFRWKESGTRAYGVIAQQAAPIYSDPFNQNADTGRWFVDYSRYVPILIQESKTLKTRIADLEERLNAAMSRLDVLDKFREKIEAL